MSCNHTLVPFSKSDFLEFLKAVELDKCIEVISNVPSEEVDCDFLADVVHQTAALLITKTVNSAELLEVLLRKINHLPSFFLLLEQLLINYSFGRIVDVAVTEFSRRTNEVREKEDIWDQIIYSLPFKLEKVSCALIADENPEGLDVSTHFLRMYSLTPEMLTLSFRELISSVLYFYKPDDSALQPFLLILRKRLPFHPYIVYNGSSSLIPSVFSPLFIVGSVLSSLQDYSAVSESQRENIRDNVLCRNMEVLLIHLSESLIKSFIAETKDLLLNMFPYIQNFTLPGRVDLMQKCEKLISLCDDTCRVVIIKRLIEEMSMVNKAHAGESMILAWLIDLYRANIDHFVFVEELGAVWSLLETLRFEDPVAAASYYISIFNLCQAQALRKLKISMLHEVKTKVMDSIREQIRDFTRLQDLKERSIKTEEMDNSAALRNQFNLLVFNMNYANDIVSSVLSK